MELWIRHTSLGTLPLEREEEPHRLVAGIGGGSAAELDTRCVEKITPPMFELP